jgi:hypothetical protein
VATGTRSLTELAFFIGGFFRGLMPRRARRVASDRRKKRYFPFSPLSYASARPSPNRPSSAQIRRVFGQGLRRATVIPHTQRILESSVCVGQYQLRRIELFRHSREISACFVRIAGDDQAVLLLFKAANSVERVYNIGNCISGDYHMTSLTSDRLSLTARYR